MDTLKMIIGELMERARQRSLWLEVDRGMENSAGVREQIMIPKLWVATLLAVAFFLGMLAGGAWL